MGPRRRVSRRGGGCWRRRRRKVQKASENLSEASGWLRGFTAGVEGGLVAGFSRVFRCRRLGHFLVGVGRNNGMPRCMCGVWVTGRAQTARQSSGCQVSALGESRLAPLLEGQRGVEDTSRRQGQRYPGHTGPPRRNAAPFTANVLVTRSWRWRLHPCMYKYRRSRDRRLQLPTCAESALLGGYAQASSASLWLARASASRHPGTFVSTVTSNWERHGPINLN